MNPAILIDAILRHRKIMIIATKTYLALKTNKINDKHKLNEVVFYKFIILTVLKSKMGLHIINSSNRYNPKKNLLRLKLKTYKSKKSLIQLESH